MGRRRASVYKKNFKTIANELGLTGWTRITVNDQMQIFVEGSEAAVKEVISNLQLGRLGSITDTITISRSPPVGYCSFEIVLPEQMRKISANHAKTMLLRAEVLSQEFQDLSHFVMTLTRGDASATAKVQASPLAKAVPSSYLGEPLLDRKEKLPFKLTEAVGSFSSECWSQVIFNEELKELKFTRPEDLLDSKVNGQTFVRSLGYKVPDVYRTSVHLNEIDLRPGIVIKPHRGSGSKGVYSIVSQDRIFNLGNNTVLNSFEELLFDAKKHARRSQNEDRWIVEELILNHDYNIPNDLKMLTFYGKTAIIQEATRMPTRVCYYNRSGERIQTGRYLNMEFEGTGVLPEYVKAAEEISLHIPCPFLRIDFLKSKDGPVFGEFTPRPGNFHKFNTETDAWLGCEFAKARARLTADLLRGKKFVEYTRFVETHGLTEQFSESCRE